MNDVESYRYARRHRASSRIEIDVDPRTQGQRDRDRILYSSAFRRLSGITQVASPTEFHPVHNRLIHSLKVAQVGRSLAMQLLSRVEWLPLIEELGGLDPDVVEAACLAHDLGHPPFGHVAESELDDLLLEGAAGVRVPDGYNGNAQTLRIVTRLAVRYDDIPGLNLTRATLNAILKYPWRRGTDLPIRHKWGAYNDDSDDFDWCRGGLPVGVGERTLEAQLMDWADDITYAVHDVEDFYRAGLIPLDRFATDRRARNDFLDIAIRREGVDPEKAEMLRAAFERREIVKWGFGRPFRGNAIDRAALRGFTSRLIGRFVQHSLSLERNDGRAELRIDDGIESEVRILKALTRHYVIESPTMVTQRFGQRALIRSLFQTFCNAATSSRDVSIFPEFYRDEAREANGEPKRTKRIVSDLISGMGEAQIVAVHQRLSGQSLGSATDTYLS